METDPSVLGVLFFVPFTFKWTKMTKVLCGHRFGSTSLLLFISHHLPPISDDYPIQLTPPPPL
ncbi:hypothetical protein T03_14710 [Trichinella britovi]|uniref:Uncharacterized protein n=1 Tax=Trichinella britovi TaxID=45882 RepID=A0A0V1D905_TRIBR|nr:hypothetical protein T03_14710 [Trichinella britovi]